MNCDYLHHYLQFSEAIQNVNLPGSTNSGFLDTDRVEGSVMGKQNVRLEWTGKSSVNIPDMV